MKINYIFMLYNISKNLHSGYQMSYLYISNNQKKQITMEKFIFNFMNGYFESEISEEMAKKIIKDNKEYIVWANGKPIKNDELRNLFLLIYKDKKYSLTMKNEDFYIYDIIYF